MRYEDRADAGRQPAVRPQDLRCNDAAVLALPRGGVPVAYEVARRLGVPMDVLVVRKLGVPWQPELEFGAISEEGVRVISQDVLFESGLSSLPLTGRTTAVVDDGQATGATADAACRAARARGGLGRPRRPRRGGRKSAAPARSS